MGGFDDHGVIIGDWMPPSPSPRSFFAAMLGDNAGPRSVLDPPKYENNNDGGFTFPGPERQIVNSSDQETRKGEIGEQRRGGLVERMAARAGHNAPRLNTDIIKPSDTLQNQQIRSPYLTIPPGLSPTSLLDSPVFLSNSLVQPSPTTGKFQFAPNGNGRSSMMFSDSSNRSSKDNFFEDFNSASFAFKPFPDHVNPQFMSTQSFQTSETLVQPEKQFQPQKPEVTQNEKKPEVNNNFMSQMTHFEALNNGGNSERTLEVQHHNHHHDDDADQRLSGDNNNNNNNGNNSNASSEDGYNWRKYGQKQVKGSEYPRSYYKCTSPNCPVKKKVERSHEGHITEIIYKGAHNHPKLGPNRRPGIGSSGDLQGEMNEQNVDSWGTMNVQHNKGNNLNWHQESSNLEVTSSGMVLHGQNGQFESSEAVDGSSTFSNDEEEDDRATHGSVSLAYNDGEGDESESKRRKVEAYAADVSGATRAIREPRVVVQTTSEVDILDDGYRWRKYGQKVVKGNPNPRSYYKCTSAGCTVRKHVERASHDLKSVITTYEGKHNHDVPAARNSSHNNNNNNNSQALSIHSQVHHMGPTQNTMARFERPSFGHLMGPTQTNHGYGFSMGQQGPGGLAHMAMAANHGKMPALPVHHYLGQAQPRLMNEMGLMVPKGEPKVEPMTDPGLNGATMYHHQMMNRLPLGP